MQLLPTLTPTTGAQKISLPGTNEPGKHPATLQKLISKFGHNFSNFVQTEFGYDDLTKLSEGQARYLLTFNSLDAIRKRKAQSLGRTDRQDPGRTLCRASEAEQLRSWAQQTADQLTGLYASLNGFGEAAILRHNSATLDFNGFQPTYTRLESYDHLIIKSSMEKSAKIYLG
ncbi:MAG: hypothetical protein KatS3mg031_0174 [Chitinophagales bacterium]|nr:MAG: hypothetical protein KatS3mg031_0174 [Chitinophagales bacterium]